MIGYPLPVPWQLDVPRASGAMELSGRCERVAVVGGAADAIIRIVGETGVDLAELHGDEPPAVVEAVAGLACGW